MAGSLIGEPSSDWLMQALRSEQQIDTAVEVFARLHERPSETNRFSADRRYRDLIPSGLPGQGEQYAFEVDLDACSGCKACVTACHNLNGLEAGESWRRVGQLQGGSSESSFLQHVTAACHHCLDPACLSGCPVEAYEKDPLTGIVRHLDDQCIGCRYCMWTCPYDVPYFSHSKGIVRKCDMCSERLANAQAPACVAACPQGAISIGIVNRDAIIEVSETSPLLPAAPDPHRTLPATQYKTTRSWPRNILPADYYSAHAGDGHLPLVAMLVMTQLSVGTLCVEVLGRIANAGASAGIGTRWHLLVSLLAGVIGLAAAILHLGRPRYAFRALLGLRRSWLSREILAFTLFAVAAAVYSALGWWYELKMQRPGSMSWVGGTAGLSGVAAILSSVMIYVSTGRPLWSWLRTTSLFLLTAAILGLATSLLVSLAAAAFGQAADLHTALAERATSWCGLLMLAVGLKLAVELSLLLHLRGRHHTPHKRAGLLLAGSFSMLLVKRCFCGVLGGLLLPSLLIGQRSISAAAGYHPVFILAISAAVLLLLIAGELIERYLFFAAAVSPRMPGLPAA